MAEGRLAVVGAGLAGVAAAVWLKHHGHRVDLYERSRLLGGKATSFEIDGIEVDNGQHVFLACCVEFIEFIHELGLTLGSGPGSASPDPLYIQTRFEALLLRRGAEPVRIREAALPAPFHLLGALLASRHLGLAGRAQVAAALIALRRDPLPGESFARWLRRHRQGDAAIAGFWEPFLVPALNAPLDQAAAGAAGFVIQTAFLGKPGAGRFGYSKIPLARIAAHAVTKLDLVRLRTAVTGAQGEWTNQRAGIDLYIGDGKKETYDGVVLAAPPDRLKSLLKTPRQLGIFGLDQFRYAAIVDIHLWFDIPRRTVLGKDADFAALLGSPIQWVFEKAAPPGETYLCCSMSAADVYVGQPRDSLVQLARHELSAVLPVLKEAKLLRAAATRDREATFVPSIGLIRPGVKTSSRRVTVAGAWTDTGWPATMESAVRSGRQAAEALHEAIAA